MKCPNCGANIADSKCEYCGYEKMSAYKNTTEKGTEQTGKNGMDNRVSDSDKNRVFALVLCTLLGFLGAHYFYVGRFGMGIIYLCTGGLFGIGWFVDIIRILAGTFPRL